MKQIIFLFLLGIISLDLYGQDEAIAYIKQHAIPVTANADSGWQDLAPLKTVLANRRIIGMGEATHGTHEFQTAKMHMLQFLVSEMGFRVFGIEANFTECRKVNDYVLYGKGDAITAIDSTYFWTWKTKEVVKMIAWMRNYNINKPDSAKVKFYGFDMQFDQAALKFVAGKLKRFDSSYYNTHFKAFDTLRICDTSKIGYRKFSRQQVNDIKHLLAGMQSYISSQNAGLLKIYAAAEVAYLEHDVQVLGQCLDEDIAIRRTNSYNQYVGRNRDNCMAENVEWILNFEGTQSKMMLWAHNGHIAKKEYNMGAQLKNKYKAQYYAIGFDFNKGSFRAMDLGVVHHALKNFTVNDAESESSGYLFSQLKMPSFFIDMEGAVTGKSTARAFFTRAIRQRSIGAAFSVNGEMGYYVNDALYDNFDGLIFISQTTPTMAMR